MAAVPVTLNVVIYPKAKGGAPAPYPAVLVGEAWVRGLHVDAGPPRPPLGTWGGAGEPFPTPPIALPPVDTAPPEVPTTPSEPKPPPPEGGWGWHPDYGWGYFPGPGQAGPKK